MDLTRHMCTHRAGLCLQLEGAINFAFLALCQMIRIWTQCAGDHLIIHFHYCHHHHDQRHDHHHASQHQQHDQRLSSIEET